MDQIVKSVKEIIEDVEQDLRRTNQKIASAAKSCNYEVVVISATQANGYKNSLSLLNTALSIIEKNASDEKAAVAKTKDYLIHMMTIGADDRWSGRENDMKRSIHDMVISYISKVQDILKYDI